MRSCSRSALGLFFAFLLAGCAPAEGTEPRTPPPAGPAATTPAPTATTPAPAAPAADPFAVEGTLDEEALPLLKPPTFDLAAIPLPPAPVAVPAAPASCDAFAKRKAPKKLACGKDAAAGLAALDQALAERDAAARDALLVDAEACAALPAGVVRALRADLAPAECGDVLAEPLAKGPPKTMPGAVYHALVGHVLAGRLARTVGKPPKLAPPYDKKRVESFVKGAVADWIKEQARAIEEIEKVGAKLPYYGKAIVAVEAGLADMRFVEAMRDVPIPDDFAKDQELRDTYYGNLEHALDPRKERGRDAALVGLRELAFVGVARDARVDRARKLLSELYGGRRIDALDGLVVPPLPAATPGTVEERLAAALPSFYAGILLAPEAATRPTTLRFLVERGLSLPHRMAIKGAGDGIGPELRALYARARLDLGQRYWRRVDVDHATKLLAGWPKDPPRSAEQTLLFALALGLRGGPEDAAAMMRRAPLAALGFGNVAALDAVARGKGALAFAAAYDAAYLKNLAAPQGADTGYFADVARRFRDAAALAPDAASKKTAEDRAKAAEDTATALRGTAPAPKAGASPPPAGAPR